MFGFISVSMAQNTWFSLAVFFAGFLAPHQVRSPSGGGGWLAEAALARCEGVAVLCSRRWAEAAEGGARGGLGWVGLVWVSKPFPFLLGWVWFGWLLGGWLVAWGDAGSFCCTHYFCQAALA